ncbi:MAG: hypothetical protein WEE36_03500 [Acidimicrobiia bacterium]
MTRDPDSVLLSETVRAFRPRCPGCEPAEMGAAGVRPCSYYDCPGLPAELKVTCEKCMYDFATDDGQVKCDHTTCETALRLKANVPIYEAWVEMVQREAGRWVTRAGP